MIEFLKSDQAPDEIVSTPSEVLLPMGQSRITESRDYYLGNNEKLFRVLQIISPLFLVSIIINVFLIIHTPAPVYFAVTPEFGVKEIAPLTEPIMSSTNLVNWASQVVTASLSLNFLHWQKQLLDIQNNFEPEAYKSFVNSIESGGHIQKIRSERLSLSCVVTQAPVITSSGLLSGRMTWLMEIPVLVSYQSSSGVVATQSLLVKLMVRRCQAKANPRGVVISQLVLMKR